MSSPSPKSVDFEKEESYESEDEEEGWRPHFDDNKQHDNFNRNDDEAYCSSDDSDQEHKSDDSHTERSDYTGIDDVVNNNNSYIEEGDDTHTSTGSRDEISDDDYSIVKDDLQIDDAPNGETDNNSQREEEYDDGNGSYLDSRFSSPREERPLHDKDDNSFYSDDRSFHSGEESESYYSEEGSRSASESESESESDLSDEKSFYSDGKSNISTSEKKESRADCSQDDSYNSSETQSLPGGHDREKSPHQAEHNLENNYQAFMNSENINKNDKEIENENENESYQSEINDSDKGDDSFPQIISNELLPDDNNSNNNNDSTNIEMHKMQHEDAQSKHVSDDERSINSQNNKSHRSDSKRSYESTSDYFQGDSQMSSESYRSESLGENGNNIATFAEDSSDNDDNDASKSPKQNDEVNQQSFPPTANFEQGNFQKEIVVSDSVEGSTKEMAFSDDFDEDDFFAKNGTSYGSSIKEKSSNKSTDDFGSARYFDDDFGSTDLLFSKTDETLQNNNEEYSPENFSDGNTENVSRVHEETGGVDFGIDLFAGDGFSRESVKEVPEVNNENLSRVHEETGGDDFGTDLFAGDGFPRESIKEVSEADNEDCNESYSSEKYSSAEEDMKKSTVVESQEGSHHSSSVVDENEGWSESYSSEGYSSAEEDMKISTVVESQEGSQHSSSVVDEVENEGWSESYSSEEYSSAEEDMKISTVVESQGGTQHSSSVGDEVDNEGCSESYSSEEYSSAEEDMKISTVVESQGGSQHSSGRGDEVDNEDFNGKYSSSGRGDELDNEDCNGSYSSEEYSSAEEDMKISTVVESQEGSQHSSGRGDELDNEDCNGSYSSEEYSSAEEDMKISTVVESQEGSLRSSSAGDEENEARASQNDSSEHEDFIVVEDHYDKLSCEEITKDENDQTAKPLVSTTQNGKTENSFSSCDSEEENSTNPRASKPRSGTVSFTVKEPIMGGKILIILCTMFPTTETETHDQNQAAKICESNKILPFILMGEHEPPQRDELLAISEEDVFPQFFLYWNQNVEFLGDFLDIYEMDENDQFNQGMLECSSSKTISEISHAEDVSNDQSVSVNSKEEKESLESSFDSAKDSTQFVNNVEGAGSFDNNRVNDLALNTTNNNNNNNNTSSECSGSHIDEVEELSQVNDQAVKNLGVNNDWDSPESSFASRSDSDSGSFEHEGNESRSSDNQIKNDRYLNNEKNGSSNSSFRGSEDSGTTQDDDAMGSRSNEKDEDSLYDDTDDPVSIKHDANEFRPLDNQIIDDPYSNNDEEESPYESSHGSVESSGSLKDGVDESGLLNNQNENTFASDNKDEDSSESSLDGNDNSILSKNEANELGSLDNQVLDESYEYPYGSTGSSRSFKDEVDESKSLHQKEIDSVSNDRDQDSSESFYGDSLGSGFSKDVRPPYDQSERSLSNQDSKMLSTYREDGDGDKLENSTLSNGNRVDNDAGKDPLPVRTSEIRETMGELHDESICDSKDDSSVYSDSKSFLSKGTTKSQRNVNLKDREQNKFSNDSLRQQQTSATDRDSSYLPKPSNVSESIDKIGDESEASMMIGEVFGQPNELFEDYEKDVQSYIESSVDTTPTNQTSNEHVQSSINSSDIQHDMALQQDVDSSKNQSSTESSVDTTPTNQTSNEHVQSSINSSDIQHDMALQQDVDYSKSDFQAPSEDSEAIMQPKDCTTKESNDTMIETEINKETRGSTEKDISRSKKKKKKRRRRKKEAKSPALLDFAANVNDAILDLEDQLGPDEQNIDSSAYRLLHGFDALLGIFLQLSDELELIVTFSKFKKKKDEEPVVHVLALKAILSFADTFDQLFNDLKPIILDCFEEEPDEYMDDVIYRLNSLVDLVCETTHRVGERQEWTERAETTYVTLLELIERDSLELRCYFDDVDTPDQGISANVHEAWSATGHIEELRALQNIDDPILFRQICYEVMLSTDQWCPDASVLMDICDIDPELLEEEPDQAYLEEDELAPIPQAAEHILDKVNGETLPRTHVFASILRRILPPRAVTDPALLDNFTSIRNTIQSPLGLSSTNIVSISSVPETMNDPDALGVAGVGKTTLAAMVAEHTDVRRYFIDGVVWIYVGDEELNYNRYTQCLRELVAQLDFYDGVPLFAELVHTPCETLSKRRRREEGFMVYARDTIAGLLQDRSVLIILDDVCFEPDMDWFDFAPMPGESIDGQDDNCALVITTRCRSLLPAADTVEIDMLEEGDAISLLIQESGQLSHTLMAESEEARSVVRECANHPLAVKSVGRWLNLKHATAGVVSSVEEIHAEVMKSMDKILTTGDTTGTDMMYEILSMSLSPAINGGPTDIIKFCFAAFIVVFCDRKYISDFALTEPTPIIPMDMAELLFETLLEMYEVSLLKKGSLFYAQKREASVLIPEALSALGVLKVITYSDAEDEEENPEDEQKFLQVMHSIHHEYGEYLANDELSLKDFTKDAERHWNRALVDAYLSRVKEWDTDFEEAAHSYALEMIISHMIRGDMFSAAADLLTEKTFIRGRLLSLGRENSTKRHIKDCEMLFTKLSEQRPGSSKLDPRLVMKHAYQALGRQLAINDQERSTEDVRIKNVEVARARYEIGFSLAENRCWDAAIFHWEKSRELLASALGTVEVVAGILYNIGVVYSEMNEYDQALDALKNCLKIRGPIHGGKFEPKK
jgi:hypothetical protein